MTLSNSTLTRDAGGAAACPAKSSARAATSPWSVLPQREYERAVELMLTHRGKANEVIDRILQDDPESVRAHCLRAALVVSADDVSATPLLEASLNTIEDLVHDEHDPARRHAAAARAWLIGEDALSVERYGALVIDHPHDIVALFVAHALDFRYGRRSMLRDRIAQVLPEWDEDAPNYASVLAMYAFGLEENGEYIAAEGIARRALSIDHRHLGAVHVVAHVMEMQGRSSEGLAFLADTAAAWPEGSGFAVHLAWHRALFHIDADDPQTALAVYDLAMAETPASNLAALADASALLWRLQLEDVDVGARWLLLADRWERHALSGVQPFFVVHAMMAFAGAGRAAAAERALLILVRGARPAAYSEDALFPPLARALLAYARGDYSACIDWLVRVRHIADRCGGSVAQCDIIHLTYTEAAFRARQDKLARALVAERAALKPRSRLNGRLQERLQHIPAPAERPHRQPRTA